MNGNTQTWIPTMIALLAYYGTITSPQPETTLIEQSSSLFQLAEVTPVKRRTANNTEETCGTGTCSAPSDDADGDNKCGAASCGEGQCASTVCASI